MVIFRQARGRKMPSEGQGCCCHVKVNLSVLACQSSLRLEHLGRTSYCNGGTYKKDIKECGHIVCVGIEHRLVKGHGGCVVI